MTADDIQTALAAEMINTDGPATPFATADNVVKIAIDFLRSNGCEHKDEVIKAADRIFEQFIRPIDIPGIPNLIVEKKVDDAIKQLMLYGLKRLAKEVCGDDGAPDDTINIVVD